MKISKPKNPNYCATVIKISKVVKLENCDNVQGAIIMGNQVIVGNDTKIDDVGLYFPLECQLSKEYLSSNNLYRKPEFNSDTTKVGYFEENGRVRCVKFRGHKSEGLYMPLRSLMFIFKEVPENIDLIPLDSDFDEINGIPICNKYIVKKREPGVPGSKKNKKKEIRHSRLVDGQFRLHTDTEMLYRNLNKFNPTDLISISYKIHGCSAISSKILTIKKLKWYEKILKVFGINIVDTIYDNIYSSRKVIKNQYEDNLKNGFYDVDIWGIANNYLKEYLQNGLTLYYEIVGYLPSGSMIQKDYDYGCINPLELWNRKDFKSEADYHKEYMNGKDDKKSVKIFIYRITYTNPSGKVFEFSFKQVQDWCKERSLELIPQFYYGKVSEYYKLFEGIENKEKRRKIQNLFKKEDNSWKSQFLEDMKSLFNEKDCFMCNNPVPEEGIVIRIEKNTNEAYKLKSNRFYARETALMDKGIENIDDN